MSLLFNMLSRLVINFSSKEQVSWLWVVVFLIYFWPCRVFIAAHGLSLVAAGQGSSLAVMHRLVTAVASFVLEIGL